MNDNHESWTRKAWQGLLLLVVIAMGARVVYGLLVPLLPVAIALLVFGLVLVLIFQRRHK
jgi:uncharacterized membrane protein